MPFATNFSQQETPIIHISTSVRGTMPKMDIYPPSFVYPSNMCPLGILVYVCRLKLSKIV